MAEVMAATAILGIVIVATISQLKLSSKSALDMAADAEVSNLTNKIVSAVGNYEVCYKNFGNKSQVATYTELFYTDDTSLAKVGASADPKAEVQLSSITTKSISANEMVLVLAFQKKKFGLGSFFSAGPKREIPINTILSGATIQYCFANYDFVVKTAMRQACMGPRSYFNETANPPFGSCEHLVKTENCAQNEFLVTAIAANGRMEFTCKPIAGVCPIEGQAIVGYNPDGTTKCDYVLPQCAAGEVIVKHAGGHVCRKIDCTSHSGIAAFGGFDASGQIICTPIATTSNVCATNQYAKSISADGKTINCSTPLFSGGANSCAPGEFISGINSTAGIVCSKFINLPATCQKGEAVQGVDPNGDVSCDAISRKLACNGSTHTYNDCILAGGAPAAQGTSVSHCRFSGAYCPGGWNPCGSYTSQYSMTCRDTSNTYYCQQWQQERTAVAPTGNNNYSNSARGQVTCKTWNGAPGTWGGCVAYDLAPTYTTINEIGCY